MKDTSEIKEKILTTLRIRGPCLPVHIAKDIGMSILFTSAFLSELLSEKKIKISNMKVGSSSIHYLNGQEQKLENFSQYLKSREKDAYELLREKKFLKDIEQEPAIRVALGAIKDFAIPFQRGNQKLWRYFTSLEQDLPIEEEIKPEPETKQEEVIIQEMENNSEEDKEPKKENKKPRASKKATKNRGNSQKKDEKFFNRVKEFLTEKEIEILDIKGFNKSSLILTIKKGNQEILLIAHNKKRIDEEDIISANKKASELNLKYLLLSLGEPQKKLKSLIDSINNLYEIGKIE